MNLVDMSDDEIMEIANPIWDSLVQASNKKDYGGFTKHFAKDMLFGANEVEIGKQWASNKMLTTLSTDREYFGCLRRKDHVTILFKQTSTEMPGEYLGRLVLGIEDDSVKVFGATIF